MAEDSSGRSTELLAAGTEARPEQGTGSEAGLDQVFTDGLGRMEVQPDRSALVTLFVEVLHLRIWYGDAMRSCRPPLFWKRKFEPHRYVRQMVLPILPKLARP